MKIHRIERAPAIAGFDHAFFCPACECGHGISTREPGPVWTFDGNFEKPTITPSIRCEISHPNDDGTRTIVSLCHSTVTAGMITFCADCTHAMVNQTVPLPDF